MAKKIDKFTEGYVCAVATLIRMHGSFQEALDLMGCVSRSKAILLKLGVDLDDIATLENNGILTD